MIEIPYYTSAWDAARRSPKQRGADGYLFFGTSKSEMEYAITLLESETHPKHLQFAYEIVTRYLVRLKLIEPTFVEPPELITRLTAARILM